MEEEKFTRQADKKEAKVIDREIEATEPYYPLISCIMPTAGRAAYVARSVGYFLAQDYPNKELVIAFNKDSDPMLGIDSVYVAAVGSLQTAETNKTNSLYGKDIAYFGSLETAYRYDEVDRLRQAATGYRYDEVNRLRRAWDIACFGSLETACRYDEVNRLRQAMALIICYGEQGKKERLNFQETLLKRL